MRPVLEIETIKQILVDIKGNLEKQAQNQRENWSVLVPVDSQKTLPLKRGYKFKLEPEDELRVNLKHLVHYTLLWIMCVDNYCNLHHVLKTKSGRYPRRMEWNDNKRKFQDMKVMHGWHPLAMQHPRYLLVKPRKFITEKCLSGYQ